MAPNDEDKVQGRIHGEQPDPGAPETLPIRLVYMVLVWIMVQVAQWMLGALAVVQFVILILNDRKPNERLADLGTDLGVWVAKAARFLTAASDVKPWPWTELD